MTLDEAIKHCEEKAEEKKKEADYLDAPYGMDTSERTSCLECANDHLQLAQWLKELKARREADMTKNCFGCNGDKDFGCEDCLNKFKGDLISREALKKAIDAAYEEYDGYDPNDLMRFAERVDEEIDNAPTVVDATCPNCDSGYAQGYSDGYLKGKEDRPHGKWEEPFEMNGKSYHKCTNCHISSELILIDKYCPECGADMR